MKVTLIGIDLAKNIFQVCGVNQAGNKVFNRQIKRNQLLETLAQYPGVIIAMEACGGSNYWGRELEKRGYPVRLIPAQHVKPFVKGNKTDRNDAFAICEAAMRPNMQFVLPRSVEQTDMILVHRIRDRRVRVRTALINQLRGLLREYGVVVPSGREKLYAELPFILEDADNGLSIPARQWLFELWQEWRQIEEAIVDLDQAITVQVKQSEPASRLTQIKGVGDKTASAAVAMIGQGRHFRNSRHFAATLGLVPKEHSSGGQQKLGSITKRGNPYLRRLLVQGAWSVISNLRYQPKDALSVWAKTLIERRGKHKAAIAIAHKLARVIWSMLYHGTEYRATSKA